MSFLKTIITFGVGISVGYGIAGQTNTTKPYIEADSSGIRIGNTKIVDVSEDKEKIKIMNIFELNNNFTEKKK